MRVGDPPVGGRYSLVEPFGADERFAGGKVQTWRAHDTLVDRDVVLRVITPGGNSAKLFMDRALEMSLIAHPALGVVYEAVDHGDFAIVVCEWIEGTSLADTLKAHGPLTPPIARKTLADVAEAVTVAHHAGLPIGGITPERVVLRDNAAVTVSGVPALFADERGDIQQLGRLLYAALTGEQPDLDDPDLARHLHRGVPRDLAVLCQRALDTDPARQLGSAAAFAAVLRSRKRPPATPKTTAGRTGDRLGGLDPTRTSPTHDTAPARLAQGKQRSAEAESAPGQNHPQGLATQSPANPAAPPTVAIPLATGVPAAKASTKTPRTVAIPITPRATTTDTGRPRTTDEIPMGKGAATPASPAPVQTAAAVSAPTSAPELPAPTSSPRRDVGPESGTDFDRNSALYAFSGRTQETTSDTGEDYDAWEDTGQWGSYDDSADDPDSASFEGSQTQRRVLLYAVPVLALLLVIVLAVVVGKQFSDSLTDDEGDGVLPPVGSSATVVPTESEPAPSEGGEPAGPVALAPVSAAVFNPFGDGDPEHDDEVPLAYDGDGASAWTTLTYQNTPEFGNLKPGVGLIFDLGREYAISTVELATTLPGSSVEVRVGAAPDAALDSYPVVGSLDPFVETGSVALAEPVRAQFVIVWFVRLVESDGGFQGALAECRILGA